jgi:hypothetical protein
MWANLDEQCLNQMPSSECLRAHLHTTSLYSEYVAGQEDKESCILCRKDDLETVHDLIKESVNREDPGH